MDFSTETMTILRRGGDPWPKTAPTGADAACVQARSPTRWARNSPSIARNARIAQDQAEYQSRFDKLTDGHTTLLEEYHRLLDQISDLDNRQAAYCHYQEELDKLDIDHIEFTPYLWHTLVDHAEISVESTITFTFRDGRSQAITLKN
ncbi:hypothetical protein [Dermabacter vaginalis]|uniref:hypothetical protein n=3 Tax=Dermabacter TaxID=36739 RepID=UPI0016896EFD